jgi:hypothetical protein
MESLGAALGMLVGVAGLAIALWEFPKFRRALVSDYQGVVLLFSAALLLGGWVGYWIAVNLFRQ